jgi:tRNA (cytidine/uridine-2'-O-)-methyltransferase
MRVKHAKLQGGEGGFGISGGRERRPPGSGVEGASARLWCFLPFKACETPLLPTQPEPVLPNRLRSPTRVRPFHVVLVEPEIPPNTGNVARLCAATCCPLHLVGRLAFSIDEHAVRRAGLDYWPLVEVHTHEDLSAAEAVVRELAAPAPSRTWLFSGKATTSYLDVEFQFGDALVFGKESSGLPDALLRERIDHVVGIPTLGPVRSLNLANSVAIVVYEALRRTGALSETSLAG